VNPILFVPVVAVPDLSVKGLEGPWHEERRGILKKLCNILYDKGYTLKGAKIAYGKLVSQLVKSGLGTSV
jgi:hypothetical protein